MDCQQSEHQNFQSFGSRLILQKISKATRRLSFYQTDVHRNFKSIELVSGNGTGCCGLGGLPSRRRLLDQTCAQSGDSGGWKLVVTCLSPTAGVDGFVIRVEEARAAACMLQLTFDDKQGKASSVSKEWGMRDSWGTEFWRIDLHFLLS